MFFNYGYADEMKRQIELRECLLTNGETILHKEYGSAHYKVSIKIIEYNGKKYYLAESYVFGLIEVLEI